MSTFLLPFLSPISHPVDESSSPYGRLNDKTRDWTVERRFHGRRGSVADAVTIAIQLDPSISFYGLARVSASNPPIGQTCKSPRARKHARVCSVPLLPSAFVPTIRGESRGTITDKAARLIRKMRDREEISRIREDVSFRGRKKREEKGRKGGENGSTPWVLWFNDRQRMRRKMDRDLLELCTASPSHVRYTCI